LQFVTETKKQYLPHTVLAVVLGVACLGAQATSFKCQSHRNCSTGTAELDSTTLRGTTDADADTFRKRSGDDRRSGKGGGDKDKGEGGAIDILTTTVTSIATPVPEPDSYAMMALGMGVIAWWLRRRRKT
jgi:hypothetical protein